MSEVTTGVTTELVSRAYAALATGDRSQITEYWDEGLNWLVPGHHPLSGWYHGLDAFLGFMAKVGQLSGNSFRMDPITVLTNDEYSADVTHNTGQRAGGSHKQLDIDVVHLLRWRDGRVTEGRGAIFGDGTNRFDEFWSPVDANGERLEA
jgi:ketosteroid isomerase-like protein